jgi:hypothetical protein
MARADLHYALALDSEIFQASRVDPTVLDPVVRPRAGLPGPARPITVVRYYQGPQGYYGEYAELRDGDGGVIGRTRRQRVHLTGEMFEDRFTSQLPDLYLADYNNLELACFVNDEEVGSVPVFIEAATGGSPSTAAEETFKKALKKGTIAWLTVPGKVTGWRRKKQQPHTAPVWFVMEHDKVFVLTGPGEQKIPGIEDADEVELTVRSKDDRSRVSRVDAAVRRVAGDEELFDEVAKAGLGKRLNLVDGQDALERWRSECAMFELTPDFGETEAEEGAPPAAAAAQPAVDGQAETAGTQAGGGESKEEDVHVEAQIDQEVFDQLISEGKSERIARSKAKAAFVKKEKARLRAEQQGDGEQAGGGGSGGDAAGGAGGDGETEGAESGGDGQEAAEQEPASA